MSEDRKIIRLLCIPFVSMRVDVFKDSNFTTFRQHIENWPEVFCYVLLNTDAEVPDEYKLPNIEYIKLAQWKPYIHNQAMIPDEVFDLFNPFNGKYQVDAILTSKTISAVPLKRMLSNELISVPVIVLENWISKELSSHPDTELKLRSISYSECPTVFATSRERDMAFDFSKRFLSSKALSDCKRNSTVRSQGVHAKRIRGVCGSVDKFDTFTCVFSARFNPNKQWDSILGVYEDIYRMGCDVQIKAVSTLDRPPDVEKRFTAVEFLPPQSYEGYLKLISKSHVAVSMSLDEGFSLGWSEHLCTGNPVLLPDRDWAVEMVGKDYPYLYSTEMELLAMLKWVYSNYDEARYKVSDFSDRYVRDNDTSVSSKEILDLVQSNFGGTWMNFDSWDSKWRATLDKMPEEFLFADFLSVAAKDYGASFGLFTPPHLARVGAYRNIYMWLCNNAEALHKPEMTFRA